MPETWQVWVAIYAAIVATGALSLEVRRWFEGRARLYVSATPGMKGYNLPWNDDKSLLLVNVTNRGGSPTTIQILGLQVFPTRWHRILRMPSQQMVIPDPSIPGTGAGQIPYLLEPGAQWTGAAEDNDDLRKWIETGGLYVAVHASHQDRPVLAHVKPGRYEPEEQESPEEGA